MPMTPLQSWAFMILMFIGVIALVQLITASKEDWRELFFPSRTRDEENEDD